jgi:hypothetical protein
MDTKKFIKKIPVSKIALQNMLHGAERNPTKLGYETRLVKLGHRSPIICISLAFKRMVSRKGFMRDDLA